MSIIHTTSGPLFARTLGAHMAGAGSWKPRTVKRATGGIGLIIFFAIILSVFGYEAWRVVGWAVTL